MTLEIGTELDLVTPTKYHVESMRLSKPHLLGIDFMSSVC
jgi:hypothetical protein